MKTILLLEDDKNLNTMIAGRLRKEGYQVLQAFSIAEAKRISDEEDIAMVISDVMLPDGNGMEFASRHCYGNQRCHASGWKRYGVCFPNP